MTKHTIKGIIRHYYNEDKSHRPYRGVVKELDDLSARNWREEVDNVMAFALDGAEVVITVEVKSVHSASKGYIWKLTKPHTYERVKDNQGDQSPREE